MKTRQAKFNPKHSVFYARCPYCGALVVFWSASAVAGACRHFQGVDGLLVFFHSGDNKWLNQNSTR